MTNRRATAVCLAVLLSLLLGCRLVTNLFPKKGKAVSTVAPELPAAPKPLAVKPGTPEERAVYLDYEPFEQVELANRRERNQPRRVDHPTSRTRGLIQNFLG